MQQKTNNWQIKKLGEVCEVITGTTPSKKDEENYGSDLPFCKPPHLWDNEISFTIEEMLSYKGAKKARVVPPNTVLVTCIGNLGRTGCEALATLTCITFFVDWPPTLLSPPT